MTREQIIHIQEKTGSIPDGVFGPISMRNVQAHLRAMMPTPNPWPMDRAWDNRRHVKAFFGEPGDEANLVNLDVVDLDIRYAGNPVKSIRCHRLVASSLRRVLERISAGPHASLLRNYAGAYNNRQIRGGASKSLHAWGAAIDIDPATNTLRRRWPDSATMPIEVMEAFAAEGWLSAGAFWGYDAMHFQATA